MKAKLVLSLIATLLFTTSYAHHFIPEYKTDIDPPACYVEGQPVKIVIRDEVYSSGRGGYESSSRCGSGRWYRRERRCGNDRYYERRGAWRRYYRDADRYDQIRFVRHKWENRLEGYWEESDSWNHQYEIEVLHHAVRIRKTGWFVWHTMYPVTLSRRYGLFENDHGDFIEWDNGRLFWHKKGRRIRSLYRPNDRSCRR